MKDFGVKTKALNMVREMIRKNVDEEKLSQLTQGKKVTDLAARVIPNHYQYPANSKRLVSRGSFRYELDLSDLMDWHAFYGFREESTDFLISLCRPNDVVFDVGSNIGVILLRMGEKVRPGGKAYGFEPFSGLFEKCSKNLSLNSSDNIVLHQLALGEKTDSGTMKVCDPHNQGKNRIVNSSEGHGPSITITTMDDFVSAQRIQSLNLIKIDVEGYEYKVLKGANQTLQKFHPDLFIEIDDTNLAEQGHTPQQVLQLLEGHGYSTVEVLSKRPVSSQMDFSDCHIDIYSTQRGS